MPSSHPDLPPRPPAAPHSGLLATPPDDTTAVRPGWTEILIGVGVAVVLEFGGVPLIKQMGLDPLTYGLVIGSWSGVVGLAGAAAAWAPRIRSWAVFGVRATSWRWLVLAVGAGVAAWLLSHVVILGYLALTGDTTDVEQVYSQTGTAGPASLVLNLVLLAVLTPVGEELLYRGVVATALMRYGPVVGVVGSAVIFAAVHGLNGVAIAAFIVGLINAVLLRGSGSIWPGVVVHVVNNLIANGIGVLLAVAS